MDKHQILLRFGGVRGSIPTSEPDQAHFGGNTSCVEIIAADNTHYIFDAGTGIRPLSNQLAAQQSDPYEVHVFLSHTHWDHIIGLPFFAPLHQPFAKIHFYGPQRAAHELEDIILGLFKAPYFPVTPDNIKAELFFHELKDNELTLGRHKLITAPHPHPNGALTFRLEVDGNVITYVTDIEHTKDRLVPSVIELSRDADALIHDSHFHAEDLPKHRAWGHSSWVECTEVARLANVKQLYLFHYSPNYTDAIVNDMEAKAQQAFPNTVAAYQGLQINLPVK